MALLVWVPKAQDASPFAVWLASSVCLTSTVRVKPLVAARPGQHVGRATRWVARLDDSTHPAGWPRRGFARLGDEVTRGSHFSPHDPDRLLLSCNPDDQSGVWATLSIKSFITSMVGSAHPTGLAVKAMSVPHGCGRGRSGFAEAPVGWRHDSGASSKPSASGLPSPVLAAGQLWLSLGELDVTSDLDGMFLNLPMRLDGHIFRLDKHLFRLHGHLL